MSDILQRYIQDDSGASAVEYALFFGLIGLAVIGGANLFTERLDGQWNYVDDTFKENGAKTP